MARRRKIDAFTRKELVVVIAVIFVLGGLLVPSLKRAEQKSSRITCMNHFMQIGTAYRIWANDHAEKYPTSFPQTNGGWRDLLNLPNAGAYAWTNYMIMSNELGESATILVCPSDVRKPADTFSDLSNINISYFEDVNASDVDPQSILGGDRNLGPGTTPDAEYGFSPADGKGNDVTVKGPACWSLKMHSHGNPSGAGNILLGDGSAQQTTSDSLYTNWMKSALSQNTNGIRLIFP